MSDNGKPKKLDVKKLQELGRFWMNTTARIID